MKQLLYIILGAIILIGIIVGGYTINKNKNSETEQVVIEDTTPPEPERLKIGVMLPFSGDAASYGESIKRGIELAYQDLNLSQAVELVYEDTKCDSSDAVNGITRLINTEQVVAVIGELCSGATLSAAPIAEENNVVLISPGSTSKDITQAGDFIFRTIPSDSLQGVFGARLVYHDEHRSMAVLYSNEPYGSGFNEVLSAAFADLGGTVVAQESFESGATDFKTQLTKVKSARPDAIYMITNSPESIVALIKQIREFGITVPLYGSEGFKADVITEGAGDAAEGLMVTSVSSGTSNFAKLHNDTYDAAPGPFAAQGYDALAAIIIAAQQGAQSPQDIKNNLSTVVFDGASGHIAFDENGDISGNYEVYQVTDGEFVPVDVDIQMPAMTEGEAMEAEVPINDTEATTTDDMMQAEPGDEHSGAMEEQPLDNDSSGETMTP